MLAAEQAFSALSSIRASLTMSKWEPVLGCPGKSYPGQTQSTGRPVGVLSRFGSSHSVLPVLCVLLEQVFSLAMSLDPLKSPLGTERVGPKGRP